MDVSTLDLTEDSTHVKNTGGRWRVLAVVLVAVCLGLLIAVVVLALKLPDAEKKPEVAGTTSSYRMCGSDDSSYVIDTSEAENPGLFDDLTVKELKNIHEYIYGVSDMNVVNASSVALNSTYIRIIDFHAPNKAEALAYLDRDGPKPNRTARLVLFRGDAVPPVVEEYIVGPLPSPTWHRLYTSARRNPSKFAYRPVGMPEFIYFFTTMYADIDKTVGHILKESYDATLTNCGDKCLMILATSLGSGVTGQETRKAWVVVAHHVEYYSLHSLDFMFLLNMDLMNTSKNVIERVVYAGVDYTSLEDLATKYNSTASVPKTKVPFPVNDRKLFSSMNRRGDPVPKEPKRAPRTFEPDGKRYSVKHRTVEYMQWKFSFRMSSLTGPQLYDIRFNDERIVYEMGLQDKAVYYSGKNAYFKTAIYVDSSAILGINSQALIRGVDCPEVSTFVDIAHAGILLGNVPQVLERAFCLFEHNRDIPLRRHSSYFRGEGGFYSGMTDNVLVLRSVMTIGNYDTAIDFIFHQNGGLEVRVVTSGFLLSSFHTSGETPYGFKLHENIFGPMHYLMFLFKVDIDIGGTSNRYETLDVSTEKVTNEYAANVPLYQMRFDRKLKQTEMEAAYKHDFDLPKFHLFHNDQKKTKYGEMKAYRIKLNGMSKQMLPPDIGNELSVSWMRQQLAVTKFKEGEREASSHNGQFDSLDPMVNFTSFITDDENIVDEDLVLWVPLGDHQIPHTEDLPVQSTAGSELGFILLPYNYFPECPSSQSRDSIRLEYKNKAKPEDGVKVIRYGNKGSSNCVVKEPDFDKFIKDRPNSVLQ